MIEGHVYRVILEHAAIFLGLIQDLKAFQWICWNFWKKHLQGSEVIFPQAQVQTYAATHSQPVRFSQDNLVNIAAFERYWPLLNDWRRWNKLNVAKKFPESAEILSPVYWKTKPFFGIASNYWEKKIKPNIVIYVQKRRKITSKMLYLI